jgi:hypothetical protein
MWVRVAGVGGDVGVVGLLGCMVVGLELFVLRKTRYMGLIDVNIVYFSFSCTCRGPRTGFFWLD